DLGSGFLFRFLFPEPKAAQKRVGVVANPATFGDLLQVFDLAAAEYDVVGMNRVNEAGNQPFNVLPPYFFAQPFARADSNVVLVGFALVLETRNFSRFSDAVDHHRGAETRPEPNEKHLPAFVTAQGLHGGIVHDFYRHSEGATKVV